MLAVQPAAVDAVAAVAAAAFIATQMDWSLARSATAAVVADAAAGASMDGSATKRAVAGRQPQLWKKEPVPGVGGKAAGLKGPGGNEAGVGTGQMVGGAGGLGDGGGGDGAGGLGLGGEGLGGDGLDGVGWGEGKPLEEEEVRQGFYQEGNLEQACRGVRPARDSHVAAGQWSRNSLAAHGDVPCDLASMRARMGHDPSRA